MSTDQDTTRTPTDLPGAGPQQLPDELPVYTAPPQPVVSTPVVAANQPPKRRAGRVLDIALALAAVLAIGGVAFAVGRATAPAPAQAARGFNGNGGFFRNGGSFDPGAGGGNGQGPRFAFGGGGGLAIDGTVTAISADSITIKRADGQEVTFDLTGTTSYHQATTGAASDVSVGDNVSVRVTPDGRLGGGGQAGAGSQGGQGNATASGAPTLSASDVTVTH
jgi:hypothetical protein